MPAKDPRHDKGVRQSNGLRPASDFEQARRRYQRIAREPGPPSSDRAASSGSDCQPSTASLNPDLLNPAGVAASGQEIQYQCTECDMIVKASDPYCPFCGAIFADGPMASGEQVAEVPEKVEHRQEPVKEEFYKPEKFDVFEIIRPRPKSRELLHREALRGFAGSARLLEDIEHLISELSGLGMDTAQARRLIGNAWEACREGDWNLVSTLARQTEEVMAPSIPALVMAELTKAKQYLMDAKSAGVDISEHILRVKSAMYALQNDDPDEALRLTKELIDILREDSVSWNRRNSGSYSTIRN